MVLCCPSPPPTPSSLLSLPPLLLMSTPGGVFFEDMTPQFFFLDLFLPILFHLFSLASSAKALFFLPCLRRLVSSFEPLDLFALVVTVTLLGLLVSLFLRLSRLFFFTFLPQMKHDKALKRWVLFFLSVFFFLFQYCLSPFLVWGIPL